MGAGSGVVLIRMSPLTVTGDVKMRVAAVWNITVDNVPRRVGENYFQAGAGSHPGRAAEPSLVLTLLLTWVVILSIV